MRIALVSIVTIAPYATLKYVPYAPHFAPRGRINSARQIRRAEPRAIAQLSGGWYRAEWKEIVDEIAPAAATRTF